MKTGLLLLLLVSFISCNSKEDEAKEKAKNDLISMYKSDIEKSKSDLKYIKIEKETWGDCIDDSKNDSETILSCGEKWREACGRYDEKEKEIKELEKELLKIKQQ